MKFDLLCLLQVISNFAYDIHYTAKGKFFYSDHIFSERLGDRDEFSDIQDDLIETLWLGRGEDAPKSADISAKVAEMTPEVLPETDKNFKALRELIIAALVMIEQMTGLRVGEQDIIGSIAHILQRHNGLLYRQLVYTPEEVKNSNEAWDNLVKPDDTMGTKENDKGFWMGLKAPLKKLFNDRWITVGARAKTEDDEGRKGRHILLKDGETPPEAMKRQWGVDVTKGKDKSTETEKKTETQEPKAEKKEETRYKTPTAEWAELLDKEKKEGLSDAEKARKQELMDKEGFEEKSREETAEDEMDRLETQSRQIEQSIKQARQEFVENDGIYSQLSKQLEETKTKAFDSENEDVSYSDVFKIRRQLEDREEYLIKKFNEEPNALFEKRDEIKAQTESVREEFNRAVKERVLKESKELQKKFDTFVPAKNLSEAKEYSKNIANSFYFKDGDNMDTVNTVNKTLTGLLAKYESTEKIEHYGVANMGLNIMHANNDTIEMNPIWSRMSNEQIAKEFKSWNTREKAEEKIAMLQKQRSEALIKGENTWTLDAEIANMTAQKRYKRWAVQTSEENFIRDTTYHEFGHTIMFRKMVEEVMGKNGTGGKIALSLIGAKNLTNTKIGKNIVATFKKAKKLGDIFEISEYANKDYYEFFAETFAMRESGQKLPQYIETMLKEVTGK